jgi:hypothetical protein
MMADIIRFPAPLEASTPIKMTARKSGKRGHNIGDVTAGRLYGKQTMDM